MKTQLYIYFFIFVFIKSNAQVIYFNNLYLDQIINGIDKYKIQREIFKHYYNKDSMAVGDFFDGKMKIINKTTLLNKDFDSIVEYCNVNGFNWLFDDSLFYFKKVNFIIDTLRFFKPNTTIKKKSHIFKVVNKVIPYLRINPKNNYFVLKDIGYGRLGLSIVMQDFRSSKQIVFLFNKYAYQKPSLIEISYDYDSNHPLTDYYPNSPFYPHRYP